MKVAVLWSLALAWPALAVFAGQRPAVADEPSEVVYRVMYPSLPPQARKEYTITVRDGVAEFVVHAGSLEDPVLVRDAAVVPEDVVGELRSGEPGLAGPWGPAPLCVGAFESELDVTTGQGPRHVTGSGCGGRAGAAIEAYIGPVKRLFDLDRLLGERRLAPDDQ
ncbi:hypothetical protein Srot_0325 [Segniliparus rotundus DSM 44985]|uniref:Uncharacterized protein n=1 Tax=Segniliparus rotundus (strain ATCC BAA-972 / CDC 1076 / CIP 108378 / DSM 44985 / JCM 13578) TaxID=640132 RepID=D6ZB53_SEGRD|nr:hypothetical protein [Segniliparus rotundus]ADG96812.1 hypothetical protein Srot_0325 [Segniliparus rotundus DSM 44985]